MLDKLKGIIKNDEHNKINDKYILIPQKDINKALRRKITELEKIGDESSEVLQRKYEKAFELRGKRNLRVWVCRDIDGDEIKGLTSEKCLEKEYRSQIVIDYDSPNTDDDFYAETIDLWYCFGGYSEGSGTLYDLSKNELKTDIEETLKTLLR
ncbi:hypothetical protein ACFQ1X_05000 [Metaplanococcus flavidus]|uniref:Uncharacterized protein n=1 Tax=Metaplanococcus flavidus TaxID=569883 RepID=A0ABW3LBA3_9BACL